MARHRAANVARVSTARAHARADSFSEQPERGVCSGEPRDGNAEG